MIPIIQNGSWNYPGDTPSAAILKNPMESPVSLHYGCASYFGLFPEKFWTMGCCQRKGTCLCRNDKGKTYRDTLVFIFHAMFGRISGVSIPEYVKGWVHFLGSYSQHDKELKSRDTVVRRTSSTWNRNRSIYFSFPEVWFVSFPSSISFLLILMIFFLDMCVFSGYVLYFLIAIHANMFNWMQHIVNFHWVVLDFL